MAAEALVLIPASDEADRLLPCLRSAERVGATWVVLDGSDPATREIAERHAAHVLTLPFADSASLKNSALDRLPAADGSWVFLLDADERITAELADELRACVRAAAPEVAAFSVPRINRVGSRTPRGGDWWPDRNIRLVRKGRIRFEPRSVHAEVEVSGRVEALREPLIHLARGCLADHVRRQARYAALDALDLRDRWGGRPRPLPLRALGGRWRPVLRLSWMLCPLRPGAIACWLYLARGGHRDGALGWILAVLEGARQAWTEAALAHSPLRKAPR